MKIKCYGISIDVFTDYYEPAGFKELPPQPTMDGASLRRLGKVPGDYSLIRADDPSNRSIDYREAVALKNGMEFLAIPPAYSGGSP